MAAQSELSGRGMVAMNSSAKNFLLFRWEDLAAADGVKLAIGRTR